MGVGHLGRHHARILGQLPGVELQWVVDINRERADAVAHESRARAAYDYRDVLGQVDAVTLAVPTALHAEIGRHLLQSGVPTLIEKPIARTLSEADALVAAAAQSDAVLAVGHTERFNPAVAAVRPLLTDPRFIEVHRLGTFPDRSLDIDVVLDVMIHDLDVVLSIVRSNVESLEAVGVPVVTPRVDIANVRLRFANGCIANLTASRISRDRVRKIRFFQPATYVSVDYASAKADVWRVIQGNGPMPTIEGGELPVEPAEPLASELKDFVEAIRHKREPLVTGPEGRRALALALDIAERMRASLKA